MNVREKQEEYEEKYLDKKAKRSSKARRWKKDNPDEYRTEYQRDIGRILFSDAFRRLRMKTQIFIASGMDQHNRTRMTHSLEVSQIAKSIAKTLNLNVDLVEAIALGHDLGHTPFGHAGETALNNCLKSRGCGTFNHNAQSVWIVRKYLEGRKDINGQFYPGFNLTYDVVEGIWKHTDIDKSKEEFDDLKQLKPEDYKGSLEAQVVNISDGIAYIRHDIEDAVRQKIITYPQFENDIWKNHFTTPFNNKTWIHSFIYDLIQNNCELHKIQFSEQFSLAFNDIKKFIYNNVILSDKVKQKDNEGIEKISTIFEYCLNNPEYIDRKYSNVNRYKISKYGLERTVVDFIQWCGDELANEIYNSIK